MTARTKTLWIVVAGLTQGLSSFKASECADQMQSGKEVACGLVVACRAHDGLQIA